MQWHPQIERQLIIDLRIAYARTDIIHHHQRQLGIDITINILTATDMLRHLTNEKHD